MTSTPTQQQREDAAICRRALEIISSALELWPADSEPPHFAATNPLIQTIAWGEGKSIKEIVPTLPSLRPRRGASDD